MGVIEKKREDCTIGKRKKEERLREESGE